MAPYTMFKADGTPVRVSMQGWLLEVELAEAPGPQQAHELAHVVQQRSGVRAWLNKKVGVSAPAAGVSVRAWDYKAKQKVTGAANVEVDDEVLIAFEHGDTKQVTIYFNPKEITISKPTPWKVELEPNVVAAARIVVRSRGAGTLGVAVQTSDAGGGQAARWTKVL